MRPIGQVATLISLLTKVATLTHTSHLTHLSVHQRLVGGDLPAVTVEAGK